MSAMAPDHYALLQFGLVLAMLEGVTKPVNLAAFSFEGLNENAWRQVVGRAVAVRQAAVIRVYAYRTAGGNTNTILVTDRQYAKLAPYTSGTAGVYTCPADKSSVKTRGGVFPRVRRT